MCGVKAEDNLWESVLSLHCGIQGSNLEPEAYRWAPLHAEPSCQPDENTFNPLPNFYPSWTKKGFNITFLHPTVSAYLVAFNFSHQLIQKEN